MAGAAVLPGAAARAKGDPTGTDESTTDAGAAPLGYGSTPTLAGSLSPGSSDLSDLSGGPDNRWGDRLSGSVQKLDPDSSVSTDLTSGADLYAFDADAGTEFTVKYDRDDPRGVSAVGVYDADGTLVDQGYVNGDSPVYLPGTADAGGTQFLQVRDLADGGGEYSLSLSTAVTTPEQSPYEGTVTSLPGRIQAQNFDVGGEGVAYSDTSSENTYDTTYRDAAVDLRETADESGAYNVGYFQEGEWLEYTVDPDPGVYDVHLRVATPIAERQLELSLDGDAFATVDVPDTGGWRAWETVTVEGVSLDDGQQVLRVESLTSGVDFNWVEFEGVDLQGPFEGTPASVPGRIQAQNFDTGGEGIAYSDTTAENKYDTTYRDTAVDLRETEDESGAYNVGYFEDGEWLEYTVDVDPGRYDLQVRLASARSGRELAVSLDGERLGTVGVPDTGGWTNWQTATLEDVPIETGGRRVLRLEAVGSGIDVNWVEFAPTDTSDGGDDTNDGGDDSTGGGDDTVQSPFGGTPLSMPGRIQAEDFDAGGEGVAYSDTTAENKYDTTYRDTAVDIRETADESGAYNVGYFEDGEWLEYTVDSSPGTYDLRVRVASARSGRKLAVSLGGEQLGTVEIPDTGGWTNWQTATLEGVDVTSDEQQILRLEAVGSGIDLNWVEFATSLNDYGDEGYGQMGYGGS